MEPTNTTVAFTAFGILIAIALVLAYNRGYNAALLFSARREGRWQG